jgi:hypothetical protein
MRQSKPFVFAVLVLAADVVFAEVFKCIDERGVASYQDTSCSTAAAQVPIDDRYANVLTLSIPAQDVKTISAIAAEGDRQASRRIEARNLQIRNTLLEIEKRKSECNALKASYDAMHVRHRRYGRDDPDAESLLISQMREACSN